MKYLIILLMIGINVAKGQTKDSCQSYKDSVIKYTGNIKIWELQKTPNNPPSANLLIQEKINTLNAKREEFLAIVKKCKP